MKQFTNSPSASSTTGIIPVISVLWSLIGMGLAASYPLSEWPATAGILMITQAFCGAFAWHRFSLMRDAILPDYLSLFLLTQFVNKSLTALNEVFKTDREAGGAISENLSVSSLPQEYLFYAEAIFLLATVIFTLTFRVLEGRTTPGVWQVPDSRITWATFGLSSAAIIAIQASGFGSYLGMTQELLRYFSIGSIAVLLGGQTDYALGRKRSWLPLLALMPVAFYALTSGVKGEIALVSLPVLLPAIRKLNLTRSLLLGGFLVFTVMFVFPYTRAWRDANWFGLGGTENADIWTVSSSVFSRWQQEGPLAMAAEGATHWMSRVSSAEAGGLVMMIADRDGPIGAETIEGFLTIFIPRFLWPDKPAYAPGAWFTWYLGEAPSPETATSSTAMMLPTELYWMYGIVGVSLGMLLLAVLNFHIWRYLNLKAAQGRMVPSVALFALLANAIVLEPSAVIYAFSGPVILLVYVIIFDQLQRLFMPRFSLTNTKNQSSS
jgi:hypothetical protein